MTIDIYKSSNIKITPPETISKYKPFCVFGVLKTEEGKKIKGEMLEWLLPVYNVYIVEQDSPGKYFEYPAIKFMIDLLRDEDIKYCLYVHTKGASIKRDISKCVRMFWKNEFTKHKDWYFNKLNTDEPMVVLPATGKDKTTWLNGFYMNKEASKKTDIKLDTNNRFYYETIYRNSNKEVNVLGRLRNDVIDGSKSKEEYKKYIMTFNDMKYKKVVYTCITGNYDNLLGPNYVSKDFDYVCFTDNSGITSNVWKILPLPKETENLSNVKKQRYIKINPHKVLKEYDLSIWVDANVDLNADLNELLNKESDNIKKNSIVIYKHPSRNCIYKEMDVCVKIKKDTKENIESQKLRYKKEGFPENYGLLQSNILIRRHNDSECIRVMETWSYEVMNFSHRDQLSFNYALWKNKPVKVGYLDRMIFKSKWFFWNVKHKVVKENKIGIEYKKAKHYIHSVNKPKKRLTTDIAYFIR